VDAAPTGCGFSYDINTDYGDTLSKVRSITRYPTVSVDDAPDGTISLTTTSADGIAQLTAVSTDCAGNVTPVNQEPRITFSGTLQWDDGDPSTASASTD
jgi:hypothetical protein